MGLVADYDLQDIKHGFWGLPEQGEHERFRAFYTQFRAIPRGEFRRLDGAADDPVTVRVGDKGYYLVNRTPYEVEASWKENGAARNAQLGNCEIRYFPAPGGARISDFAASVGKKDSEALSKRLEVLEEAAKEDPLNRELADVSARARAALRDGRCSEAASYFRTAAEHLPSRSASRARAATCASSLLKGSSFAASSSTSSRFASVAESFFPTLAVKPDIRAPPGAGKYLISQLPSSAYLTAPFSFHDASTLHGILLTR